MSYDFMFQIYSIKIILLLNILLFIYYINKIFLYRDSGETEHSMK